MLGHWILFRTFDGSTGTSANCSITTNVREVTSVSLRVLGHWVLNRIYGPKRDEVTGGWRKLQNKEIYIVQGG
jgi:hypothetical protein